MSTSRLAVCLGLVRVTSGIRKEEPIVTQIVGVLWICFDRAHVMLLCLVVERRSFSVEKYGEVSKAVGVLGVDLECFAIQPFRAV